MKAAIVTVDANGSSAPKQAVSLDRIVKEFNRRFRSPEHFAANIDGICDDSAWSLNGIHVKAKDGTHVFIFGAQAWMGPAYLEALAERASS